jgi:phosphoglycolate phosphatase
MTTKKGDRPLFLAKRGTALVVFDLDGTLIDSRRDLADAANRLIEERGAAPLSVDAITAMVGEGAGVLVRRALTQAGVEPDLPRDLDRFLELYDQRLLVHTTLYPGVRDALDVLAARGPLAVLTNKPQRPTDVILDGLGVRARFTAVIGGDTTFGRKPDPAALLELVRRAGVTAGDTILVGDSAIDVRTARAAATRLCAVRYGFGFSTAAPELLDGDIVIATPEDLPAALETLPS